MKKLAKQFYNNFKEKEFRFMLYAVWLISIAFFVSQFPKLSVAFEFEKFFADDNEDKVFFEKHVEKFGYDNDYLLVAIENEPTVFESDFLTKIEQWKNELDTLTGLVGTQSVFDLKHLIKSPYGITAVPLLHIEDSKKLQSDSSRIMRHPLYSNFISKDGKSLIIQLNHQHFKSPQTEQEFFHSLKSSLAQSNIKDYRLVGKLVAQQSFINHIRSDFSVFLGLGIAVTIILLLLLYRSFNIMLLPLLMSISSLVYLLGFMAMLQVELSILSVLIPPIILFVSTSDAIHLVNAYRQNEERDFLKRLKSSIKKVFSPTFLTSITTALGFFSLLILPTQPIRELGVFAGAGVLIAFGVNFLFGPLLIRKNYRRQSIKLPYKNWTVLLIKNKKGIFAVYFILIVISIFGFLQLKTDAYLLKDLPEDSQVRNDFEYLDKSFGGSKPWEMAILPAKESDNVLGYDFLKEALKIESYLTDSFGIENFLSPLDLVKYANQIDKGGANKYYEFPDRVDFQQQESIRNTIINRGFANGLVDSSGQYARFAGFIPEWGSHDTQNRNHALASFIDREIDENILKVRITGTTYLIDKSNESLSVELMKGLLLAVLMIAIALAIYFKSFKMLLISLIPNFIPLLFTAGIMGFMDVPLKLTTAIIFVVAFGIAVDDTIHFLGAYKQQKAKSPIWRIIKTFKSAGLAILITSILIIGGFVLFTLSSFATTFYLGLFLSLAMLFALLTDLILLPLLLKK
ncbi:efflux RND transporter permease subunit [Marivirga sp.]|uniref:efflux RND transporter permease subunit n=1 Tax=Marivirga sp. TaxID=2018662 RepID=UPI002D80553F|nr:MMPL family transporter [Marivirga sp.]HET8861284.1 MMPL family transporter [Marivirga sp.]